MKNTIYLDSDFNFLLLENEEEDNGLTQTKIYINISTSAAANQALNISVAGGAPITVSIASSAKVNFELSQQYWADNGDVEITPENDDITGETITIHFPETFKASAALNYLFDDEFEIVAQNENFAEGGSGSGGGSGSASGGFDFVEIIRNIGFRLLDEPTNVNIYYDDINNEVSLKWTDPADIATNEPAPAEWAGTVVVRKEGGAPLHRWDGTEIADSTTRDEYSTNALVDNTVQQDHQYYYGIFPYDTKGDYRFTKVVAANTNATAPIITLSSLSVDMNSIIVNYSILPGYTWEYITLVYKKGSEPVSKTDGSTISLSDSSTNTIVTGLDEGSTYYFKIFAKAQGSPVTSISDALHAKTQHTVEAYLYDLQLNKVIGDNCAFGQALTIPDSFVFGMDSCMDERAGYRMPERNSNEYSYAYRSGDIKPTSVYMFALSNYKVKKITFEVKLTADNNSVLGYFIAQYMNPNNISDLSDVYIGNSAILGTHYASSVPNVVAANTWTACTKDNINANINYLLIGSMSGTTDYRNIKFTYWTD